ncbi:winged helix-turn-helix domain-containing protein, partial [Myxococcota bacterium]|nr:winged helix-turn-helix domain-containing protein [Myxococcota bacterium]
MVEARLEPLTVDYVDERVRQGDVDLKLTRRAFQVLAFLYSHPDRLVTKDELFASIWNGSAVSESALTTVIREIRRAVGDGSRDGHYIQTVHGRGYRYIGPRSAQANGSTGEPSTGSALVGRGAELEACSRWLGRCESGTRQIAFVTGEPGIGKTALIESFLESLRGDARVRIASGQCVELYGAAEPYLPWLDALAALARRVDGAQVVDVLRR